MASVSSLLRRRFAGFAGAAGDARVTLSGVWPALGVAEGGEHGTAVTGLPPGRVRVRRLTLPPAEAAVSERVAAVRAEGLLPEGVDGDTAAGAVSADHGVWVAGVSEAARSGVAGPVADAATGLAAVLASELGLGGRTAARLEAGVLLVAAAGGRLSLIRVSDRGPEEAVTLDVEGALADALRAGVERIEGGFTTLVGVGDASGDPRAGGAPLGAWADAAEAFEPLVAGGVELTGDGWLAAGAAGAVAFPGLPTPGSVADAGDVGPGPPPRGWWAAAAAAVLVGAAGLAWADLSAADRLAAELDARPGLAAAETQLRRDAALFGWLESGGPTPLAVLDEVTSLLDGVVPATLKIARDGVSLTGTVDEAQKIDALVARLSAAETLTAVRVKRTQKESDREFRYAIDATPVERFYDAFAASPADPGDEEGGGE